MVTGRHSGCGGEPGLPTQSTEGGGAVITQGREGKGKVGSCHHRHHPYGHHHRPVHDDHAAPDQEVGEERGGRQEQPSVAPTVVLFSLETLIITVSAGAVAALVVGFVTGDNY